jgi:hypothetical protein
MSKLFFDNNNELVEYVPKARDVTCTTHRSIRKLIETECESVSSASDDSELETVTPVLKKRKSPKGSISYYNLQFSNYFII